MTTPVILIVDDDIAVLEAFERDVVQRYAGEYGLERATGGEAALETCTRLRDHGRPVAVVVAGQGLASPSGPALLLEVRATHPNASRALLRTSAEAEAATVAADEIGLDRHLVKPWDPPEANLYPVLEELLSDWQRRSSLPYSRVGGVMETDVARIRHDASVRGAAEIVAHSGVGDLMVVDDHGAFVGVLSEGDILRNALPDFDDILVEGGTLHDAYQLFIRKSAEFAEKPVMPLVIRHPLVLHPDDHVARAATVLIDRQIRRLPVVDGGRLLGTVSRANICQAVVRSW